MPSTDIVLTTDERTTLDRMARARKGRADLAARAQAIVWLADGASYATLTERLGWSSRTTATWKQRFLHTNL
jgi:transposase